MLLKLLLLLLAELLLLLLTELLLLLLGLRLLPVWVLVLLLLMLGLLLLLSLLLLPLLSSFPSRYPGLPPAFLPFSPSSVCGAPTAQCAHEWIIVEKEKSMRSSHLCI
jgi:hypothetical protein